MLERAVKAAWVKVSFQLKEEVPNEHSDKCPWFKSFLTAVDIHSS